MELPRDVAAVRGDGDGDGNHSSGSALSSSSAAATRRRIPKKLHKTALT
jgi:hypothetical protein